MALRLTSKIFNVAKIFISRKCNLLENQRYVSCHAHKINFPKNNTYESLNKILFTSDEDHEVEESSSQKSLKAEDNMRNSSIPPRSNLEELSEEMPSEASELAPDAAEVASNVSEIILPNAGEILGLLLRGEKDIHGKRHKLGGKKLRQGRHRKPKKDECGDGNCEKLPFVIDFYDLEKKKRDLKKKKLKDKSGSRGSSVCGGDECKKTKGYSNIPLGGMGLNQHQAAPPQI